MKWATAAAGFAGVRLEKSANQSIPNSTQTQITWNTEIFDTNTYHDASTNTDRITIPASKVGYYFITAGIKYGDHHSSEWKRVQLRKNGTSIQSAFVDTGVGAGLPTIAATYLVYGASGDYFDCAAFQVTGAALNVEGNIDFAGISYFQAFYLGA
jgi:hypothetical protein